MPANTINSKLLLREAVTDHIRDVAAELRYWLEQMDGLEARAKGNSVTSPALPLKGNAVPFRRRKR